MIFKLGQRARYKNNEEGIISFVDPKCITICVRIFPNEKSRNVCIVVYSYDFDKVQILDVK